MRTAAAFILEWIGIAIAFLCGFPLFVAGMLMEWADDLRP